MLIRDLISSFRHHEYWLYTTWFDFLIHYRKTKIGPLWLLIAPGLFIAFLGLLFSRIGNVDAEAFIPHLTIGLIVWTLISGFVTNSTTIFQRRRSQIFQGGLSLTDLVMGGLASTILYFVHQVVLILVVMIVFQRGISLYALVSLVGLALLVLNGIWLGVVFGIIGARYRDLVEITQAIMRIAFLATPIIWIPGDIGRGGVMGAFLTLNPFYHFLELIRAPLLNIPIAPISWLVVLFTTVFGFALAQLFYMRFARSVPLWV